jgi:hypothetical protein
MSPNPAQVIVVSAVLVALASIAVALRFHVRKSRQSKLGPDDWTILVALVYSYWVFGLFIEEALLTFVFSSWLGC